MKTTFRDLEQLSAYLDGQLPQAEAARLESRLAADPALAAALEELRQARAVLRRAPRRRAPRAFTLTPQMAGLKPPVPRAVPVFSWASALATLIFLCAFGGAWMGQLTSRSAVPVMESGYGGGPAETQEVITEAAPMLAAPSGQEAADTTRLAEATPTLSATPEAASFTAQEQPLPPQAKRPAVRPWPFVWLGLAALLGGAALYLRWAAQRRFRRRYPR
ncbi:MAG: zf-HC2 domain-containing protein [Anaerolineales bacterium]